MVSGFDVNAGGQQDVKVTYGGKYVTFKVTVVLPKVTTKGNNSVAINRATNMIVGISAETVVSSLAAMLNSDGGTLRYLNGSGQEFSSGKIGTGAKVQIINCQGQVLDELTCVVTGDTNGDGSISITDLLQVKAVILGKGGLDGAYAVAADTNKDGVISITDFIQIKADILGKSKIGA